MSLAASRRLTANSSIACLRSVRRGSGGESECVSVFRCFPPVHLWHAELQGRPDRRQRGMALPALQLSAAIRVALDGGLVVAAPPGVSRCRSTGPAAGGFRVSQTETPEDVLPAVF